MLLRLLPRVRVRTLSLVALSLGAGALFFGATAERLSGRIQSYASMVTGSLGQDVFDPDVPENRVKELSIIDQVSADLRPKLQRAETLVRKQRTEIEYLRELSDLAESRLGQATLDQLRVALNTEGAAVPSGTCQEGVQWLAWQRRIGELEGERERVLQLRDRVNSLQDRLAERRDTTLGLVPREYADEKSHPVNNSEETERLLSSIHERLFKTLYAIDPELVRSEYDAMASSN